MAQFLNLLIFLFFSFILPFVSSASPQRLRALVAPTNKDTTTSLYTLNLNNQQSFVLDITSNMLWSLCPKTHPLIPCLSPQCTDAHSFISPFCPRITSTNKLPCACIVSPVNTVTRMCAFDDLTNTKLTIKTTDGHAQTAPVSIPSFVSSCAPETLLRSLPSGASGVAGLARMSLGLPSQFASSLSIARKFAICLSSISSAPGVVFFGEGPFYLLPPTDRLDVTSILSYTPLLKHPTNHDYYIDLDAIAVGGTIVPFLARMLDFDSMGHGGVKLSTTSPYATLRSHIYRAFLKAFARATRGIPRATRVKPFDLCLHTRKLGSTRLGLAVPQIDLVLANGMNWTIFGANSMRQVSDDVACLAIIDGGERCDEAVVIGSFQMENNFLLFDLAKSTLGFSSSLFLFRTTCANFNFTSEV